MILHQQMQKETPSLDRNPAPQTRSVRQYSSSTSHEERTATEPREDDILNVRLGHIEQINDSIRLMRLYSINRKSIKFLPGQWLDVFLPGLSRAGGFTITSPPSCAESTATEPGYFELAIQQSKNPPAQWLWRPVSEIDRAAIKVRVGGSFVWPPPVLGPKGRGVERLVLIAGGVGINPLMSIFSHLMEAKERPREIVFMYGTKAGGAPIEAQRILFLQRLMGLLHNKGSTTVELKLFLTDATPEDVTRSEGLPQDTHARRIGRADLEQSLGDLQGREETVCFVCGPAAMTDQFVEALGSMEGMSSDRVLCEKWW